jgi:hypothetical protein
LFVCIIQFKSLPILVHHQDGKRWKGRRRKKTFLLKWCLFPKKNPMSTKLDIYNNNRDRNYLLRHQQIMCNFWIHNPIKYTHSILNIVNVLVVVVVVISSRMCAYAWETNICDAKLQAHEECMKQVNKTFFAKVFLLSFSMFYYILSFTASF